MSASWPAKTRPVSNFCGRHVPLSALAQRPHFQLGHYSAAEIGLWDILGQALGQPAKLVGGAARKRNRMYVDVGSTPEEFLKAKGYTAANSGFIAVKDNTVVPSNAVRAGARKLAAVRQAVGDDFDIAIDAHGYPTTVMANRFCTRVEELRPL